MQLTLSRIRIYFGLFLSVDEKHARRFRWGVDKFRQAMVYGMSWGPTELVPTQAGAIRSMAPRGDALYARIGVIW